MVIILLISAFETTLFPQNLFFEEYLNPALETREGFQLVMGTGSRFGLPELRTYYVYSTIRSYRLSAQSFGCDLYRENMLKLGGCFALRKTWTVGFSVGLFNNWVQDNFNRFAYSLCIGSIFQTQPMKISGWVNNLNIPRFSNVDYLPLTYSVRFDYQTEHKVDVAFAVRSMEKDLPFFNFGAAFSPYKMIRVGAGVNTDPVYLEYVMELNVGDFIFCYSGSNQQYLGLSHTFDIRFCR